MRAAGSGEPSFVNSPEHIMSPAPRMFLKHHQAQVARPARFHLIVSMLLAVLGFTIVSLPWLTNSRTSAASIGLGGVVGVISSALAVSILYSMRKMQKHDVVVTSAGVWYNGEHWPWERVSEIRSTRVLPDGVAYIAMSVDRGPTRSFLRLPVQVRGEDPLKTIAELRQFLTDTGRSIPWHESVLDSQTTIHQSDRHPGSQGSRFP